MDLPHLECRGPFRCCGAVEGITRDGRWRESQGQGLTGASCVPGCVRAVGAVEDGDDAAWLGQFEAQCPTIPQRKHVSATRASVMEAEREGV